MTINEYKKQIEATDYWDTKAYDFSTSYFGDEAVLLFEKDSDSAWKIIFKKCAAVEYETDATWESRTSGKLPAVKDMTPAQLGYYCQDISITENPAYPGFYDVSIDLSIMNIKLTCKEIEVGAVDRKA